MAMKHVIEKEIIGKIDFVKNENKWTKEMQNLISVTLGNGVKLTFFENEATFHSVGRFLKQGDIISFDAEKYSTREWQDSEGQTRTTVSLSGLSNIDVEQGAWSDQPIEGLSGRQAASDEMFKVRIPRDTSAPVGSSSAVFTAKETITGVDSAVAASATSGNPEI